MSNNFAHAHTRQESESLDDYANRRNTNFSVSRVPALALVNGEAQPVNGINLIQAESPNWTKPEFLGTVGAVTTKRKSGFWEAVQPMDVVTRLEDAAQNMGGAVTLLNFHNGVVRGRLELGESQMPAFGKRKLGEVYNKALSFEIGCNGKVGVSAAAMLTRCICDNQMVAQERAFSVRFKHNAQGLELKADELIQITAKADSFFDQQAQVMESLSKIKIDDTDAMLILADAIGARSLSESLWAYHSAEGAQAGTVKGVYEAVTYMTSHTLADKRANGARGSVSSAIDAMLTGADSSDWIKRFNTWAKKPALAKDWIEAANAKIKGGAGTIENGKLVDA